MLCCLFFQRRQSDALRNLRSREFKFRDLKKQLAADATPAPASSVDEFHREINVCFLYLFLLIIFFANHVCHCLCKCCIS